MPKLIHSTRGGKKLVDDLNYVYRVDSHSKAKQYWKCEKKMCSARCHTPYPVPEHNLVIIGKNGEHAHSAMAPDDVEVRETVLQLKQRALATQVSSQELVSDAVAILGPRTPKLSHLGRRIRRWRQRANNGCAYRKQRKSDTNGEFSIVSEKSFQRCNTVAEDRRRMLFDATEENNHGVQYFTFHVQPVIVLQNQDPHTSAELWHANRGDQTCGTNDYQLFSKQLLNLVGNFNSSDRISRQDEPKSDGSDVHQNVNKEWTIAQLKEYVTFIAAAVKCVRDNEPDLDKANEHVDSLCRISSVYSRLLDEKVLSQKQRSVTCYFRPLSGAVDAGPSIKTLGAESAVLLMEPLNTEAAAVQLSDGLTTKDEECSDSAHSLVGDKKLNGGSNNGNAWSSDGFLVQSSLYNERKMSC
ncbi:hypothetical protein AB6A40_003575 [Gnathostoma spinigerum]|uniref:WRKY domain-containing protein n=1 Tax=Gnathostoma spinigerum TaxID=75299 RepID=A0ABD6EB47_9BILA